LNDKYGSKTIVDAKTPNFSFKLKLILKSKLIILENIKTYQNQLRPHESHFFTVP